MYPSRLTEVLLCLQSKVLTFLFACDLYLVCIVFPHTSRSSDKFQRRCKALVTITNMGRVTPFAIRHWLWKGRTSLTHDYLISGDLMPSCHSLMSRYVWDLQIECSSLESLLDRYLFRCLEKTVCTVSLILREMCLSLRHEVLRYVTMKEAGLVNHSEINQLIYSLSFSNSSCSFWHYMPRCSRAMWWILQID